MEANRLRNKSKEFLERDDTSRNMFSQKNSTGQASNVTGGYSNHYEMSTQEKLNFYSNEVQKMKEMHDRMEL